MKDETSFLMNGGTLYVRVPVSFVRYFKLLNNGISKDCFIEDISESTAKLSFVDKNEE
jgi:hypothetical protein